MSYIISLIIVLGVLIFFHELGHFLMARLCGVGVEKFSLGFGPRLFGKKIGLTDYRVSAIPLGGYVKMVGEEPDAGLDPAQIPLSFTHKPVIKRMLIVAAGPAFNIFLAILIFFGFFQVYGMNTLEPVVGTVLDNSPAMKANLKAGDRILSVDGIHVDSFTDMSDIVSNSGGKSIQIIISRGEKTIFVQVVPEPRPNQDLFGETVDRYMIGITASGKHIRSVKLNPLESFYQSFLQTGQVSRLMIIGIIKLIKGEISTKNLGGPIMIAQMAGDQAKQGAANLIYFIAFISINLAIINFLPIPVLDGGHLMFFLIEAIVRRPVSIKLREAAQQVGIFILVLLMIFVIYNDIVRLLP